MLTIFTIPKAFEGHSGDIQHNAVASWTSLGADCQVILFGDDAGVGAAAEAHDVEYVPDLSRTAEGTPRLDEAFARAQSMARHDIVCYSNADIIHFPTLLDAVEACRKRRFLLVGRRTDVDVVGRRDQEEGWLRTIREEARLDGVLHSPSGIDYFIFPHGQLVTMPPFPVGRALWDNWMIYDHRRRRIPVIDLTPSVLVVHQNHGYGHLAGGKETAWFGPEVTRSRELLGPDFIPFTIADATWHLEAGVVRRNLRPRQLLRQATRMPALVPGLRRAVRVARFLRQRVRSLTT